MFMPNPSTHSEGLWKSGVVGPGWEVLKRSMVVGIFMSLAYKGFRATAFLHPVARQPAMGF